MPAKIAFFATIGEAYGFVFRDWPRFFRLSLAWIAIGCALFAISLALLGPEPLRLKSLGHAPADPVRALANLIVALYAAAARIAFAVAWHRTVLLGEIRTPLRALRFRRREWRFFFYSLLVGLLAIVILWAGAAAIGFVSVVVVTGMPSFDDFHPSPWSLAIGLPLAVVGGLVWAPYMARFSLGLPAIAIEEPRGIFGRAWRRGRGNGWRLIGGSIACTLPASIVSGIVGGVGKVVELGMGWGGAWSAAGFVLAVIFDAGALVATYVAMACGVSFLSLSYRQLTRAEAGASAG